MNVGMEDVEGVTFIQKGYWVRIISSHDVDAYLIQADNSRLNLKIKVKKRHLIVEIATYNISSKIIIIIILKFAERFPKDMCYISWCP